MKKISSLVIALVTSMCSLTVWAEREAPTMPEPCVPDSGQTYVLFNVESGLCISDYNKTGEVPLPIQVHIDGNDVRLSYTDNSSVYYLNYYSSNYSVSKTTTWDASGVIWRIIGEGSSYMIQNSRTSSTYYMGTNGNTTLYWNRNSNEQIHWYFFSKEAGERYVAELSLYNALNNNDEASQQYAARGWDYTYFENMYANRANYTATEIYDAAKSLENALSLSASYQAPWWNETPILFSTPNAVNNSSYSWNSSSREVYYSNPYNNVYSRTLSATVTVDESSTFFYGINYPYSLASDTIAVFVDGVQKRLLHGYQLYHNDLSTLLSYEQIRFFEILSPGTHTITWKVNLKATCSIRDVGVMTNKDLISIDLLRPGSLGTEVLYQVNDIKDVRRLKIKGKMNDDDWTKLKMMSRLQEIDLSEAEITEIPIRQFIIFNPDTTMQFLRKVMLPEGLTKINHAAFYGSILDELALPSTLETIAGNTFYKSHIRELYLPDNLLFQPYRNNYTYENWFGYMYFLEKVKLPKNMKEIPAELFECDYYLNDVVMPDSLQSIGESAFYQTSLDSLILPEGLKTIGSYAFYYVPTYPKRLPSTLTTIGEYAFNGCKIDSLIVPNSVTSIGNYAFSNCGLKYAELGAGCYSLASNVLSGNSETLKTLKLYSPTVAKINNSNGTSYHPLTDIKKLETLLVPHYLWTGYKLDEYWYNAKNIVAFDYGNMDYIPIQSAVELGHERFGGQPSITMFASPSSLSIYGDMGQEFQNVKCNVNYGTGNYGMILNECKNISVNGVNKIDYYMGAKLWYFVSLPFDMKVSQVAVSDGTQYAIRYYDGAGRAVNGKTGNWKNYAPTDTIFAGTGFIVQLNVADWITFTAADTERKYGTFTTDEFSRTLDVNPSETPSNKGWNLVGNPYQCYYNNHSMNFTAPITIWSPSNKTYTAYSLTDDDYAIRPNEAFFVQCPSEEYNTISFPLQGRQVTSVIENQNAVKAWAPEAKMRQVINLSVSNGEMEDMTRVVLNEEASMAYETACDASKFMSMDGSVPQIYTLDAEGTQYAINERPICEGVVALGFYAGQTGDYTITVTRCDAEQVFITDKLTGETTEITNNAYTFSAKAGTNDTRFTLTFVSNDPTAIATVEQSPKAIEHSIYDLQGRQIVNGQSANRKLPGIYVVRQGNKASKVIVR